MADPKFLHYAQVIPEGFYNVAFEHEVNSDPDRWLSTWGVGADGYTLDADDLTDLGNAWQENVVEPLFSTNTGFVRVVASDAGGVLLEADRSGAGTVVGPFGPVSNSVIIEKRTALSGRHFRGRAYLPCVPDADIDENGRIDLDLRNAVVAAVEAFRVAVLGTMDIATLVLLHSKGWGPPENPGQAEPPDPGNAPDPTPITGFTSRPVVGTQRSRVR